MLVLQQLSKQQSAVRFAVGDSVNHFPAAVYAVPAGKIFRNEKFDPWPDPRECARLLRSDTAARLKKFEQRRLPNGGNHHVTREAEFRTRNVLQRTI